VGKEIGIIGVLIIIIVGLVWLIFAGESKSDAIIATLQGQRIQLIRSNATVESELSKSKGYSKELEEDNFELEHIIDSITAGSEKTEEYIKGYGSISDDFAEFLRQATVTD